MKFTTQCYYSFDTYNFVAIVENKSGTLLDRERGRAVIQSSAQPKGQPSGKPPKRFKALRRTVFFGVCIIMFIETVYQLNNIYVRYRLNILFNEIVAEFKLPKIAIFDDDYHPFICDESMYDICFSDLLDDKYQNVYMSHTSENNCHNFDSKYCPIYIREKSIFTSKSISNIGIFNSDINVESMFIGGELSFIEANYTAIYPIWRPNPLLYIGLLFFEPLDDNSLFLCTKAYVPSFKPSQQYRPCW